MNRVSKKTIVATSVALIVLLIGGLLSGTGVITQALGLVGIQQFWSEDGGEQYAIKRLEHKYNMDFAIVEGTGNYSRDTSYPSKTKIYHYNGFAYQVDSPNDTFEVEVSSHGKFIDEYEQYAFNGGAEQEAKGLCSTLDNVVSCTGETNSRSLEDGLFDQYKTYKKYRKDNGINVTVGLSGEDPLTKPESYVDDISKLQANILASDHPTGNLTVIANDHVIWHQTFKGPESEVSKAEIALGIKSYSLVSDGVSESVSDLNEME